MLKIDNKIILIILFILKLVILFIIGGVGYMGVEIWWRGFSHWTMGIVGGLCFLMVGGINEFLPWDMSIWKQGLIGAGIVTLTELISGIILNVILGLGIWDYTGLPGALFWGQICLPYTIAWFFLSIVVIVLDDWIRWLVFGEEKPHYNWKLN